MADEYPESDNMKNVEDKPEKMEEGEISQDSDKVAGSAHQSSSIPPKTAANPGEASACDPAAASPELPVQQQSPESGSSDKTKTGGKRPGFLKTMKKACKNVLTKISPRKHDKAPFVPEGASGIPSGVPSTAAAASGVMSRPPKGRRGTLVMESPTSEGRTLITEVSVSSDDGDFPEDADRKVSVASTDTAAHIAMLSNLDEPSLAKESGDEAKSPDEENKESGGDSDIKESGGDSDIPMESEE